MPRIRAMTFAGGLVVLMALLVSACSGAGDSETDQPAAAAQQVSETDFQVVSANFSEIRPKRRIPQSNTCYGEDMSPPLAWTNTPDDTKSFAVVADDLDHEAGEWALWVLYNIPAEVTELLEGVPTTTDVLPDGTAQGNNDFGLLGYSGPCPPPIIKTYGSDWAEILPRKYSFKLYALDADLGLAPGASKDELLAAMDGHILGEAETRGKYMTSQTLSTKGGSGFLDTSKEKSELQPGCGSYSFTKQKSECRDDWVPPEATAVTAGEKIYNSLGDLVTPTPAAGQ